MAKLRGKKMRMRPPGERLLNLALEFHTVSPPRGLERRAMTGTKRVGGRVEVSIAMMKRELIMTVSVEPSSHVLLFSCFRGGEN